MLPMISSKALNADVDRIASPFQTRKMYSFNSAPARLQRRVDAEPGFRSPRGLRTQALHTVKTLEHVRVRCVLNSIRADDCCVTCSRGTVCYSRWTSRVFIGIHDQRELNGARAGVAEPAVQDYL